MRRKVSAPDWRFPRRMTFKQWSMQPYRERHDDLARAQCTLLGFWRDCANARCRRARKCLVPYPCYWNRKQAMTPAQWARAEAACRPLRALLSLGSLKGSVAVLKFPLPERGRVRVAVAGGSLCAEALRGESGPRFEVTASRDPHLSSPCRGRKSDGGAV
jgi:hypothetical protein